MSVYICIDLKSFYASAECVARGLDPLNTNLVVADPTRTEKTICLAVTPSLKAVGVPGRPRLFEVVQIVRAVNQQRLRNAPNRVFTGTSQFADALAADPALGLDYITAPPRMQYYMDISTRIFEIYLQFVAPEDIHVYSVDEVFIDATPYLETYHCTAHTLAMRMVRTVLRQTGITATAGIGTNLYLAKVAMDIVAKKMPPDRDGVRIAELDEFSYRRELWGHRPLTDFWRIGSATARRLEREYIFTMGDLARFSEYGEDRLFRMFGVNAEFLIDHAWGYEPTPISAVKAYRPESRSVSQGQVLPKPYPASLGRLIVREMTDQLAMDLVRKGLAADQLVLHIGYDHTGIPADYTGQLTAGYFGKIVPKPAHGSANLGRHTASARQMTAAAMQLYDRIVDPSLSVRRINVTANRVIGEAEAAAERTDPVQYGLFDDAEAIRRQAEREETARAKEQRLQHALLEIKSKYGKNAVLKGMNLREGATAAERNRQIGGHKA